MNALAERFKKTDRVDIGEGVCAVLRIGFGMPYKVAIAEGRAKAIAAGVEESLAEDHGFANAVASQLFINCEDEGGNDLGVSAEDFGAFLLSNEGNDAFVRILTWMGKVAGGGEELPDGEGAEEAKN